MKGLPTAHLSKQKALKFKLLNIDCSTVSLRNNPGRSKHRTGSSKEIEVAECDDLTHEKLSIKTTQDLGRKKSFTDPPRLVSRSITLVLKVDRVTSTRPSKVRVKSNS